MNKKIDIPVDQKNNYTFVGITRDCVHAPLIIRVTGRSPWGVYPIVRLTDSADFTVVQRAPGCVRLNAA